MMILTVFVQGLQGIKCKANNQYNERNKYISKSNGCFSYNLIFQMRSHNLNNIGKQMEFVVSKQPWKTICTFTNSQLLGLSNVQKMILEKAKAHGIAYSYLKF